VRLFAPKDPVPRSASAPLRLATTRTTRGVKTNRPLTAIEKLSKRHSPRDDSVSFDGPAPRILTFNHDERGFGCTLGALIRAAHLSLETAMWLLLRGSE